MPMSCIHLTVAFLSLYVCDRVPPPSRPQVSSVRTAESRAGSSFDRSIADRRAPRQSKIDAMDVAAKLLEAAVLQAARGAAHIAAVAIVAEARLLIRLALLGRVTRENGSRALREALLETWRARFEKNMARHNSVDWSKVPARLEAGPDRLGSLHRMERTGGEPDVVGQNKEDGRVPVLRSCGLHVIGCISGGCL
jgi:Protein of unknown function (DUF4256)